MKTLSFQKAFLLITIPVACLILLWGLILYTNKEYRFTDQDFSNVKISLPAQDYTITVQYAASADTYLEGYYEAADAEWILFGAVLPKTEAGTYSIPLKLTNAIRNDSISVRVPYAEDGTYQIQSIRFKSAFPVVPVVAVILFCIASAVLYYLFTVKNRKIPKTVVVYLPFLLFAFVLMTLFSTSSPLYSFNLACDSNIYYSVGSGVANGQVLYREVFDHKGPVFFFFYALGYLLSPGHFYGIWLFEVIAFSLDLFFICKIARYHLTDTESRVVAYLSPLLLINSSFWTFGGTMEEFALPMLLGFFYLIAPFILIPKEEAENEKQKICLRFLIVGVLSSLMFFSKFNISIAWIVASIVLSFLMIKKNAMTAFFQSITSFLAGFIAAFVPVLIYCLCTKSLGELWHYYFEFNAQYGGNQSMWVTLQGAINNAYSALLEHPTISFLVLLGILSYVISKKFLTLSGKIILPLFFVVLLGTTYAGKLSFGYYYTLVAVFAVFGIIFLVRTFRSALEDLSGICNPVILALCLSLGMSFFVNRSITASWLLHSEPYAQEVFGQQMQLLSGNRDYSFFELGFLESGFFAASHQYPKVQYFFLPNITPDENPDPTNGQFSYLDNATTDFFIWAGCGAEDYPSYKGIDEHYRYVATYHKGNDPFYMLYQKTE